MTSTVRRAATLSAMLTTALFTLATPAFSQVSDAQRAAIRSECRADYQAHCASIPPGGMESLQCLQKNMSSLAPGCQSAVRAVEAPAETKAEPKPEAQPAAKAEPPTETKSEPAPAASTAKTEAAAPAKQAGSAKPTSAQIAAIRSACRPDYPKVCAGVPTGGAAALQCLEKNKSKVSAGCQKAVAAVGGGAGAAGRTTDANASPGGAAPAAAPAAPAVIVLRPMRPREQLFVLRSACGADVRALCGGIPPGGGRILQCLAEKASSLSAECRSVLSQFAAQ